MIIVAVCGQINSPFYFGSVNGYYQEVVVLVRMALHEIDRMEVLALQNIYIDKPMIRAMPLTLILETIACFGDRDSLSSITENKHKNLFRVFIEDDPKTNIDTLESAFTALNKENIQDNNIPSNSALYYFILIRTVVDILESFHGDEKSAESKDFTYNR